MRRRAAILLLWLVEALGGPAVVGAQLGPAPEIDRCGAEAARVSRFAARAHGWSTRRPSAEPKGTLGRGVIWEVYDSPACCGPGSCSTSSEREDGLIGAAGGRLFALSHPGPQARVVPAWEERLREPWVTPGWSAFLRAAHAVPRSPEEAIQTAWLVVVSAQTDQGLIPAAGAPDPVVMQGQGDRLAAMVRAAAAHGEDARSSAIATADGYRVTLWTSRLIWFPRLRVTPAGLTGDEDLRRSVVLIDRRGNVTLVSSTAPRSTASRSGASRSQSP